MSQLILLEPMTKNAWVQTYRPHVRVIVDWDAVNKLDWPSPKLHVLTKEEEIYLPSYRYGSWMRGWHKTIGPGETKALLRVPAVLHQRSQRYLLLDGMHRLLEVKPSIVVLDCMVAIGQEAESCFADLISLRQYEELPIQRRISTFPTPEGSVVGPAPGARDRVVSIYPVGGDENVHRSKRRKQRVKASRRRGVQGR